MYEKPDKKLDKNDAPSRPVALFVSGSPVGVSAETLRGLAAQTDFILAVDSGAEQLMQAGLTPDLLMGDFDSITLKTLELYRSSDVELQSFDAYKNATDIELGIEALVARGFNNCIATNVLGGRSDHALGSLGVLAGAAAQYGMRIVARDEYEACCFAYSNQGQNVLAFEMHEGSTAITYSHDRQPLTSFPFRPSSLSLVAWGGSSVVSFTGTEWELDHYLLSPYSSRGISNLARDTDVHFEIHEGEGVVLLLLSFEN